MSSCESDSLRKGTLPVWEPLSPVQSVGGLVSVRSSEEVIKGGFDHAVSPAFSVAFSNGPHQNSLPVRASSSAHYVPAWL